MTIKTLNFIDMLLKEELQKRKEKYDEAEKNKKQASNAYTHVVNHRDDYTDEESEEIRHNACAADWPFYDARDAYNEIKQVVKEFEEHKWGR